MSAATIKPMKEVTTTITLVNRIDQILVDRGFISTIAPVTLFHP
ncbi:hypothetical protein [Phormidesmis priestleyi]|nr:hypothetical protein [Phormidesmis priestleyi]